MSEAKAIEQTLYVDVSSMDLLFKECACGELHIFGFYHQFRPEEKVIDPDAMTVTLTQDCRTCGTPVQIVRALSKDKKKRSPHEQQQRINELEKCLARIAEYTKELADTAENLKTPWDVAENYPDTQVRLDRQRQLEKVAIELQALLERR